MYRKVKNPRFKRKYTRKPRIQYIRPKTELKVHDRTAAQTVSFAGSVTNLAEIAVGSSYNQRDGISITPKTLTLRYHMLTNGSMTFRQCLVRVIICRAKYENNLLLTPADILENVNSTLVTQSPKDWSKRGKTTILHDSCHALTRDNIGKGTMGKTGTIVVRLKNAIKYDANTPAGTNFENGGLYLLLVSDVSNLAPNDTPNFIYVSRLTYTDA